jgi:hypothetical protein
LFLGIVFQFEWFSLGVGMIIMCSNIGMHGKFHCLNASHIFDLVFQLVLNYLVIARVSNLERFKVGFHFMGMKKAELQS